MSASVVHDWRRFHPHARYETDTRAHTQTAVEAAVPMVRELLQLLLAFTGHADVGGVALPTLELWVYLPEMLGLLYVRSLVSLS